jgi:pimeloyl-ACP methyl ester carboxylesterase
VIGDEANGSPLRPRGDVEPEDRAAAVASEAADAPPEPTTIETFDAVLPHGITLSCRASGTAGAPLLVFLHGFPEAAFVWDELLQHFGGRYRCVAPNLRGYAGSSAPAEVEAYRAKHLVADIAALVDQLGGPLAALIAHDWGGAVAWNFAVQHPDRLKRLVIVNSPHPATFLRGLQHDLQQQAASAYMNFLRRPDAPELLAENSRCCSASTRRSRCCSPRSSSISWSPWRAATARACSAPG